MKINYDNDIHDVNTANMIFNIAAINEKQTFVDGIMLDDLIHNCIQLYEAAAELGEIDADDLGIPARDDYHVQNFVDGLQGWESVDVILEEVGLNDYYSVENGLITNGGFAKWIERERRLYAEDNVSEAMADSLITERLASAAHTMIWYGYHLIHEAMSLSSILEDNGYVDPNQ